MSTARAIALNDSSSLSRSDNLPDKLVSASKKRNRRKKAQIPKKGSIVNFQKACGLVPSDDGLQTNGPTHMDRDRPVSLAFHGVHNDVISLRNFGFDIHKRLPNLLFLLDTQTIHTQDRVNDNAQLPSLSAPHSKYVDYPTTYRFHNAGDDAAATISVLVGQLLEAQRSTPTSTNQPGSSDPPTIKDPAVFTVDLERIPSSKMTKVTECDVTRLNTQYSTSGNIKSWLGPDIRQSYHLVIMDNAIEQQEKPDSRCDPHPLDLFEQASYMAPNEADGLAWLEHILETSTI